MTIQSSAPDGRGAAKRRSDLVRGPARGRGDRQGRAGDGELRLRHRAQPRPAGGRDRPPHRRSGSTTTSSAPRSSAAPSRRRLPTIRRSAKSMRCDIAAVYDRDPACDRHIEPLLYFKGFHAIQTHRLAHWLWQQGPARFRALPAEPFVGGLPDRHPSGGADGARYLPRPRHRPRRRPHRGDRGQRLDPAGRDARRHGQGKRRPPSRRSATAS